MNKTIKELFDEKYGIVNEEGTADEKDLEDKEELKWQEHLTSSWKIDGK